MKKIFFVSLVLILLCVTFVSAANYDKNLSNKLKGKLLLATEDKGRIWYINPGDGYRYEVTFGNALPLFQKLSLGISNKDLEAISEVKSTVTGNRLKGRLLLQVEDKGRIWYIDSNGLKHEVTWGNLMSLFRKLALGITNGNLEKIEYNGLVADKVIPQIRENVTCKENSKFFIVIRSENGVLDFLIKTKTNSNEAISCEYIVNQGDFEIKNQEATLFYALTDNFLMLDTGTAPPPRTLTVYNLKTFKQVFADNFYYENFVIDNDVIQYWRPTTQQATIDNCPKLFSEYHGGARIDTYVNVDLFTLVRRELGQTRCHYTQ